MFQLSSRTIGKVATRVAAGTVALSIGTATYYRPLPVPEIKSSHKTKDSSAASTTARTTACNPATNLIHSKHASVEPDRQQEPFCSKDLPYFDREKTPFLLSIAQSLSIGCTTLLIRLFMNTYGEYHITNDEHYDHFIKLVLGGKGRNEIKQPMITVSNHRSLFDDPGVVSCLLPIWIGIQPKYNRWGICSQEYCFGDMLPAIVKGYIGAGQVLPIRRGLGIDQSLFKDFASLVARGEWCHIFPEGGVWQWDELGGRGRHAVIEEEGRNVDKSKLKWGVGKLIAHAPVRPRVVPFAHAGMENLLPQERISRKTYLKEKLIGGEPLMLRIQFGQELQFDDLIEEYEAKHGKLWVYGDGDGRNHFISSETEKELYGKIALRVEHHLEILTKEVVMKGKD
mmetsp:Transcript_22772/g.33736  ORF Transcript_22772/g.33736 Transcript_22772/m.33736 type:complete len:397 (+) Transcript_22772:83-1273(+)